MNSTARLSSWLLALTITFLLPGLSFSQGKTDPKKSDPPKTDPFEKQELSIDEDPKAPFPKRFDVPDFPKGVTWLNTSKPLSKRDLKGKFVLLDFWTYCCINCIHVLPELKKLEKKYPDKLVVIGVHSAKFETEKETRNIREAILRYEIEHPVINDFDHKVWDQFAASSWPSIRLLDPEGKLVAGHSGEIRFEDLDAFLKPAFEYYEKRGLIDKTPMKFDLESAKETATPLRFPGKILADEKNQRLFITDSNHNRIVIADAEGNLIETIGSGRIGKSDGDFESAEFDHPQGTILHGDILYVCDTENHNLRKVNLKSRQVTTIAGTGKQASRAFQHFDPSKRGYDTWKGDPKKTALNSPWALWVHKGDLYIAMAGPHQIWKMPLDESSIGPFAGNGREDIVDGALLPVQPYEAGYSSFAQPSGLASDGQWLYVADTEGSSIRAVPFDPTKKVRTVVGTADRPRGRLFIFGDQDGEKDEVLLQHAIGIAHRDSKLYVADTYNNKIKVIDAKSGQTRTLAGSGKPGRDDAAGKDATFDEPAGLTLLGETLFVADTNNHLIRKVDVTTGSVSTFSVKGLQPPNPKPLGARIMLPDADVVNLKKKVTSVDGKIIFNVTLAWPAGWKTNKLTNSEYHIYLQNPDGALDRSKIPTDKVDLGKAAQTFKIEVPVKGAGKDLIRIEMPYFYCQELDEGECKFGEVAFVVELDVVSGDVSDKGKNIIELEYAVKE